MRYQSKSAVAYMFRNFWQLAPIAAVAAVALGFFCNTHVQMDFIYAYLDGKVNSDNILTALLNTVTALRLGKTWWCWIIAVVLFVIVESLLIVKVANHMRTGVMKTLPIKSAWAVFPTVLLFVVCLVVFSELMFLIVAGIAFLARYAGPVALIVICAVLQFLAEVLTMFFAGMLIVAFPVMFFEDYSFNFALSYSVRLMSGKHGYLLVVATLFPLCKFVLTVICALINIYAATVAIFSVFYLFCVMFISCLSFKLYFDSVGGERRDISRVMFG